MRRVLGKSLLWLCLAPILCLAQAGHVDAISSGPDVPDAVKKVLEPKGYRVTLDDGSTACDLWLRDKVPTQPKQNVPGALYPQLVESTLVGVISFSQATTDYRGQAIQPGFYTLRYELMPNDGNHLGVAPNRDFLLLVPIAEDSNPEATFKFNALVELSRHATGTGHPGPLNLVQPEGGTAPAVSKDDEDRWTFSAGLKLASGEEMPFSLVVKGTAPQ